MHYFYNVKNPVMLKEGREGVDRGREKRGEEKGKKKKKIKKDL